MPRYIDAEALEKEIESLQITLCIARQSGKDLLRLFATEYKKSILKIIDEQPTADVVPKTEVERLNAELEACEEHAAITAVKEVWRELRSMCDAPHWCVWLSEIDDYFEKKTGVKTEDIDDLKKEIHGGGL